ncbi:MAG: glycosyltransferase family 2 protein [Salinivirgaceae bacterium]|nr:glycosyltransferase family 2 protein [Salinivirgaceae bacterium]
MDRKCLVSVVIPAYNAERTIKSTLDSILGQTYNNVEVLVIDDGSTDSTSIIVKSYSDTRIRLINKPNGGVSSARNLGIKSALGEYVAFCDSDDVWHPQKLEKQLEILRKDSSIDFIGCNRNNERTRVFFHNYSSLKQISFNDLLLKVFPQTSTAVIKKCVFDDVGVFDEEQRYAEDVNLWLRICYNKKCYMMPDSLVVTGGGKPHFGFSGLSANLKGMSDGIIKNINEMYAFGYITIFKKVLLVIFERIKYLRRIVICKYRNNCNLIII